jgi:predicted metal-dependent HD superfamily phosphohydrolase
VNGLDRNRWDELAGGAQNEATHWFDRLIQFYSEPHRHYHNCQHITECLNEFDSARRTAHEPRAVECAIWFHDAIYNPRAADNEEKSAELARQFVRETKPADVAGESVVQLVLATKHHDASLHRDAALMVDIDLSIFGKSPEQFWKYEQQIRGEYEWVPENIFRAKRAEILERFLSRQKIFATEMFFVKHETQARANLAESIRRLRQ